MQSKKTKARKHSGLLSGICTVLLTLLPVVAFYYTYTHYYRRAVFYSKGNVLFVLLYVALLVTFMQMYRGYNLRQSRTRELVFSFGISALFAYVIMYFVMCLVVKRLLPVRFAMLTYLVQCVLETALYVICRMLIDTIEPRLETVYVFNKKTGSQETIDKLNNRRSRYRVRDAIVDSKAWESIVEKVRGFDAVAFESPDSELRERLANYCFCEGKQFILVPGMTDIILFGSESAVIEDGLFYSLRSERTLYAYQIVKRLADILLSLLGLIVTSPLMLGVAIAIKRYDRGPVFYRQTRLTRDGHRFQLVKFRSMVVNAEQNTGAVLAGKQDSRITPVGRFIRTCRLDELPQLWNIFVGDMTLVGPRPERPEFYDQYCAEYPEFAYRLRVKAGLTGYAQLFGKYNTTFIEKAKLDMYYIQHESLFMDLQLIFYTLKILFSKESTEGVERADTSVPEESATEETAEP